MLHELYAEDIKKFKINRDVIYTNYRDMEYLARREGLKILDTPEVRQVIKLTKYCGTEMALNTGGLPQKTRGRERIHKFEI